MSFISLEFVLFMFVVVPVYFLTPQRLRWFILLVAGYYFYTRVNVGYALLLLFTTVVDYTVGRLLGRIERTDATLLRRRLLLAVSVVNDLGILFIFKYYNFFADSINNVTASTFGVEPIPILGLLLPIGISFYTFQSLGYVIDVYRGNVPAETSLINYAQFLSFFPPLLAGPIGRAKSLLPQFQIKHQFLTERVISGLRLMLWGAFKKVVIADRLAIFVNHVYANPEGFGGNGMAVATVFFAFQIYADFSGYSDIAVGAARILGFDLIINFRQPYLATSVRDFWRRWHISLSTWFRDYLYFTLGGSRVSLGRSLLNQFIVFLVSGLWHGAAWTYVIWGAFHGLALIGETLFEKANIKLPFFFHFTIVKRLYVFVVVTILWAFFRASSPDDVFYMFANLGNNGLGLDPLAAYTTSYLAPNIEFAISIGLIVFLLFTDWLEAKFNVVQEFGRIPFPVRWVFYYGLGGAVVLSYVLYGLSLGPTFLYFQF
jgi:D-alanyl-lipoteichoic acid acyltransferase DltB (MBOAT superfamily)